MKAPENKQFEDIFARNRKFPRAENIFSFNFKTIEEIKDNAVFVVDTDILLYLYQAKIPTIQVIQDLFKELIALNRFYVPAQVAREFADRKDEHLTKLQQFLKNKYEIVKPRFQSTLNKLPSILKSFPEYGDLQRIEKEIQDELDNFKFKILFTEYQKKIESMISASENWLWSDPISSIYRELFRNQVVAEIHDLENKREQFEMELDFRRSHQIPPVLDVSTKDDKGAGDFLTWQTILQLGKDLNTNVIFITSSHSKSWFAVNSDSQIFPRHELCYEFTSHTKGMSFNIITLPGILKLFNFEAEIIQDIENIEKGSQRNQVAPLGIDWIEFTRSGIETVSNSGGVLLLMNDRNEVFSIESVNKVQKRLVKYLNGEKKVSDDITYFGYHIIEDQEVAQLVKDKLKEKFLL